MQLTPDATEGGGAPQGTSLSAAFQLKGSVATLTVVRLLSPDLEQIDQQLRQSVAQQPRFFCNAPVVVDFSALGPRAGEVAFEQLVRLLRHHQLVPVAACHLDESVVQRAAAAGLGAMQEGAVRALRAMGRSAATQGARQRSPDAPAPAAMAPPAEIQRSPVASSRSISDEQAPAAAGSHRPFYQGDDEPTLVADRRPGCPGEPFFRNDDDSCSSSARHSPEAELPRSPGSQLIGQGALQDRIGHEAAEHADEPYSVVQVIELGQPRGASPDRAAQNPSAAGGQLAWRQQIATALVSGAAATAALLVVGYALRSGSGEAIRAAVAGSAGDSTRVGRAMAPPLAPEDPAQAPVESATVRVLLKVIPTSATVTFNGQRVGNPHRVELPRQAGYARLAASAPGHQPRYFDVPLTESSRWLIALHPSRPEPPRVTPQPAEAPTAERPVASWPADDFDDSPTAGLPPVTSTGELAVAPGSPSPSTNPY